MSTPTTIRSKQIGDLHAVVTTCINSRTGQFGAHFQVYRVNLNENRTHLEKSSVWSDERGATFIFDIWVKENTRIEETS